MIVPSHQRWYTGFMPNKGFKHSEDSKKKVSATLRRLFVAGAWKPGLGRKFQTGHPSYWNEDSKEMVRAKMRKERGPLNRGWKGGRSGFTNLIRKSSSMATWRKSVFERDGYRCVLCGEENGHGKTVRLEADHYPTPFAKLLTDLRITSAEQAIACEQFWDITNGRTLCRPCHNKTKNGRPKLR